MSIDGPHRSSATAHQMNERARIHWDHVIQRTTLSDIAAFIQSIHQVRPDILDQKSFLRVYQGLGEGGNPDIVQQAIEILQRYRRFRFKQDDSLGAIGNTIYKVDTVLAVLQIFLNKTRKQVGTKPTERVMNTSEVNGRLDRAIGSLRKQLWFYDFPDYPWQSDPYLQILLQELTDILRKYLQTNNKEVAKQSIEDAFSRARTRLDTKQKMDTLTSVVYHSPQDVDRIPVFRGNKEIAKICMNAFNIGVQKGFGIRSFPISRRDVKYSLPEIHVVYGHQEHHIGLQYSIGSNRILLGTTRLQEIARYEVGPVYDFYGTKGMVTHKATLEHFMILQGVEEGNHAAYIQTVEPKTIHKLGAEPGLLANYDAEDAEFFALHAQLQVAQEMKMPQITIDHIKKRISDAKKLRDKRAS